MSSSALRNVINSKAGSPGGPNGSAADALEHERPAEDMELVLGVLVENAPVCMAMFDHQMRYMLANRQWVEEFGLQAVMPLIGKSQYEVFPGLHPGWRQVYERALQGHVVRSEHDALAGPDGRRVIYRWEVRPWRRKRDATVGGLMVTCEKFGGSSALELLEADKSRQAGTAKGKIDSPFKAVARVNDYSSCALPMIIMDDLGIIQQANETAVALCLSRGIQEGSSFFWDVVSEEGKAGVIRQKTLAAFDQLVGLSAPRMQKLDVTSGNLGGTPFQWVISPSAPQEENRRFIALGLALDPAEKKAPEAEKKVLGLSPVNMPNLPALAQAVSAISQPLNNSSTGEGVASALEIRRLQDDLARARQELRVLREAEKTFAQRDNKMRQYLEAMPCGILVLNEVGTPIFQNEPLAKLLGRGLLRDESVEQWLGSVCPNDEHRQDVLAAWREDVWRRQLTRTLSLATADGLLKELEFQPVSIPGGGVLISIQDATESCRHEEQLRATEAKFRTLLQDAPIAIILMDKVGAVFEVNHQAEELLGYPKSELRRCSLDTWLEPESLAARREALRTLNDTERAVSLEVSIRHKSGAPSKATLNMAYVLDLDGQPHCMVHFIQKKEIPQELITALQPPPGLFDAAATQPPARGEETPPAPEPVPATVTTTTSVETRDRAGEVILRTNVNGRVKAWSERAETLFGINGEAALGQPLHTWFRPSDATGFYSELATYGADPETAHELSFYDAEKRKNTRRFYIKPIGDGGHDFELKELISDVISAQELQTQGDSFSLNPTIDEAHRWPIADLSREKLVLSEVHHRIKNHLQIISSLLNLNLNRASEDYLCEVLRSSQNRVRSIGDLHQHLYEMVLGTKEDFAQFAEGLSNRLRDCYGVPETQVTVHLDLQSGPIQQEWLLPLTLTLNETLSNCFEHAFPNGKKGNVWVRLSFNENGGEMKVWDNGIGLSEGFRQLAHSATGLGLKILAIFAEQLRGELLNGRSESEGGVEITLRFPTAPADN